MTWTPSQIDPSGCSTAARDIATAAMNTPTTGIKLLTNTISAKKYLLSTLNHHIAKNVATATKAAMTI